MILPLIIIIAVYYLFNPKNESGKGKKQSGKNISDEEIKNSLKDISEIFGFDTAKNIERIYRLETAHFTSGQFRNTYTGGMEKHKDSFPYGWTIAEKFWKEQPDKAPLKNTYNKVDGSGKEKEFLIFPDLFSAMFVLGLYLKKYPLERWYSTDVSKQKEYLNSINKIIPKFVNQFSKNETTNKNVGKRKKSRKQ